jgi:transposase InsO family protein
VLVVVLDVFSRRVVGWSITTHMRAELVTHALQMALGRRKPDGVVVHHSDQGANTRATTSRRRVEPPA